jgi:secreted PhoX family phosphatase
VLAELGPLRDADEHGLRLPAGFRSRIVARTGQPVTAQSSYVWHPAPDGGATFAMLDGGFVYVSNCEYHPGGAGALRFDAEGNVVDAYAILEGTRRNCAGGPTPWGTWLSCEEVADGRVFECDPRGVEPAVPRLALGQFNHEAAAVDPVRMQIYLTEDEPNGRLYRFTPSALDTSGRPVLDRGVLEVAAVDRVEGPVRWLAIADPSGIMLPTRLQADASTPFNGAEGIWHDAGVMYFATKGDNRVWALDLDAQVLTVIYDRTTSDHPILSGVDNVTVSPAGDVLVSEDTGGDMQVVGITPDGLPVALVQIVGHEGSEVTGPAFDPSGTRLYFSSQRGTAGVSEAGVTFEVTGRFFR